MLIASQHNSVIINLNPKFRKGKDIMTNVNFSAYKIYWIEFRAQKGIVTKKDEKVLGKYTTPGRNRRNLMVHFASKELAEAYLADKAWDFETKLSKAYEVRLCTDKQFGMGKVDMENNIVTIPFTEKQNSAMYLIGNK